MESSPLPNDITVTILLRLPLESIRTCKCVSKQWKNLIDDPEFTKLYHQYKSTPLFLCGENLFRLSERHETEIITSSNSLPSFKLLPIPFVVTKCLTNLDDDYNLYKLVLGSSNRIACVKTVKDHFHFYDLLTGDSHTLFDAPIRGFSSLWLCYGFGYDRYADDYKLVVVCPNKYLRPVNRTDIDRSTIFVYSFGNRCWRSMMGFTFTEYNRIERYTLRSKGYSFNGALHWVRVKISDHGKEWLLSALDLHSYRLVEMSFPSSDCRNIWSVAELDGKLCCCCVYWARFDLWVMKEYGVGESWTKLLSFDESRIKGHELNKYWIKPTLVYQCGDGRRLVLFVSYRPRMQMFWYDIDNDKIENIVDENGRGKVTIMQMFKAAIWGATTTLVGSFSVRRN